MDYLFVNRSIVVTQFTDYTVPPEDLLVLNPCLN